MTTHTLCLYENFCRRRCRSAAHALTVCTYLTVAPGAAGLAKLAALAGAQRQ